MDLFCPSSPSIQQHCCGSGHPRPAQREHCYSPWTFCPVIDAHPLKPAPPIFSHPSCLVGTVLVGSCPKLLVTMYIMVTLLRKHQPSHCCPPPPYCPLPFTVLVLVRLFPAWMRACSPCAWVASGASTFRALCHSPRASRQLPAGTNVVHTSACDCVVLGRQSRPSAGGGGETAGVACHSCKVPCLLSSLEVAAGRCTLQSECAWNLADSDCVWVSGAAGKG